MNNAELHSSRIDAVFIRKSTIGQDERGQIANVESMLNEIGVHVPKEHWFVGTVSRLKVSGNPSFTKLMNLVEAGKVRVVYIESQDRWGTSDRPELFSLLGILRNLDTKLYDLRNKKDLTENDLATEMLAFINSIKSEKELKDISYRSLRTRVNNFKNSGSWPTGTHPFGYGKACFGADGNLLWEWQPVSRSKGQIFYPNADGELKPGPANVRIPRKTNQDIVKLTPSNRIEYVESVGLIFDLYTRVGLSRRRISAQLNAEGRKFYSRPFSHTYVTQILTNPAYVGDTHFGKVQAGKLHSFDQKGIIVELKPANGKPTKPTKRKAVERLVQLDTHEPLVTRECWKLAQEKLESERTHTSYSPRNPAYYLKQLFVCGHCGKGLTGRTERHSTTGEKTVIYVCSTYVKGRCGGHDVSCGYYRITHDEAEQLLFDKIKELNLPFDDSECEQARTSLKNRLAKLRFEDDESSKQWEKWIQDGINGFAEFLIECYGVDYPMLPKLRKCALDFYCGENVGKRPMSHVSKKLTNLKTTVKAAEEMAAKEAGRKVMELQDEHEKYTRAWVRTTSELQQTVLKKDMDRLETEIGYWKSRAIPLTHRFEKLYGTEAELKKERESVIDEWPNLECREKGEALRRLFKTVTLFWDRKFHPAAKKPNRSRKTDRPGRHSYSLQRDKIEWAYADSNLVGSS